MTPELIAIAREYLSYDPLTGIFTWLKNAGRNRTKGKIAGFVDKDGYLQCSIKKKLLRQHKLAWAFSYGYWPELIDHVNRIKTDNRLVNLRLATPSQQVMNHPRRRNNTSGHKGVCWDRNRGKWVARIDAGGKTVSRRFDDFDNACTWRKEIASLMHNVFFAGE